MRISLVFPPFFLRSLYNLPPLGLLSLATVLRDAGHQVSVIDLVLSLRLKTIPLDASIYEASADTILRTEPDLVAFSAQCATFPGVVAIAEILRKRKPVIRIVAGGHDVSFTDRRTMERFPCFDAVVRGEGEITFRELVKAYDKGEIEDGIKGVTWRRRTEIVRNPDRELIENLDALPIPDYSFVPGLDVYRDACGIPRAVAVLEAGRGCPHRCVYCSESIMWRRKSRTFSISRILGEMRRLRDDSGAECYLLAYDQFTADRGFAERFCRGVIDAGLNTTPWYCISRLDSVDRPLLRLMREAGCESMCYGIDSGSERTLTFIGKRIDHGILLQRVRETTDEGMVPTLSFVVGFPEEERADIDMTLRLALRAGAQGNSNTLIQLPTVLPGTELHRRYGDRLARAADTYFSLGLEFDNGSRLDADTRRIESDPLIFSAFYNLPCSGISLTELELIASCFPYMVNLYPKSFLLIALALDRSISVLFSEFADYAAKTGEKSSRHLTPADCRSFFPPFASQALSAGKAIHCEHILDVIDYESISIDVGEFPRLETTGTADLCLLEEWFPRRNRAAVIRQFRYNLPAIISDLKDGIFHRHYAEEPTILVFLSRGGGLDVTEINEFGKDLLELCDGSMTVADIAEKLYPRFGAEMEAAGFREECGEALAALAETGLIRLDCCSPAKRKEVISC